MSGKWAPGDQVSRGGSVFFVAGMVLGSACGLVLGSALGFELRPDRVRAIKKAVRRVFGGRDDEPRFDLMV